MGHITSHTSTRNKHFTIIHNRISTLSLDFRNHLHYAPSTNRISSLYGHRKRESISPFHHNKYHNRIHTSINLSLTGTNPTQISMLLCTLRGDLEHQTTLHIGRGTFSHILSHPGKGGTHATSTKSTLTPHFMVLLISIFYQSNSFLLCALSRTLIILIIYTQFRLLSSKANYRTPLHINQRGENPNQGIIHLHPNFLHLSMSTRNIVLHRRGVLTTTRRTHPRLQRLPIMLSTMLYHHNYLPMGNMFFHLRHRMVTNHHRRGRRLRRLFRIYVMFNGFRDSTYGDVMRSTTLPRISSIQHTTRGLLRGLIMNLNFGRSVSPPQPL